MIVQQPLTARGELQRRSLASGWRSLVGTGVGTLVHSFIIIYLSLELSLEGYPSLGRRQDETL